MVPWMVEMSCPNNALQALQDCSSPRLHMPTLVQTCTEVQHTLFRTVESGLLQCTLAVLKAVLASQH